MNLEKHAEFLYYACRHASIEYGGEPIGLDRTLAWGNVPEAEKVFYRTVAASYFNYVMIGLAERVFQQWRVV